jgi:hypothetical protein
MSQLWLLRGALDAPGWKSLRADHEEEKVAIVHLDPPVWALIEADGPPEGYDGLTATEPGDGLYLDPNGSPLYVVGCHSVGNAKDVIRALGSQAEDLLERIKDPVVVLERLGRVF